MTGDRWRRRWWDDWRRRQKKQVKKVEKKVMVPIVTNKVSYMFQATQYVKNKSWGECRINPLLSDTTIFEDADAQVVAIADFDDVGGNAAASNSTYSSSYRRVPLLDNKGKTAFYHGHHDWLLWEFMHPTVDHTKKFIGGRAIRLNVPGTDSLDRRGCIYYVPHADFNISTSKSFALWFYPTEYAGVGGDDYRVLLYRYIDASNYYIVTVKNNGKLFLFVNEAGTLTKISTTAEVALNNWNLMVMTYDPATDSLAIYLNNSGSSVTHADVYTPPHTVDTNLFLSGLPANTNSRLRTYLAGFIAWSGEILTPIQVSRLWHYGTADSSRTPPAAGLDIFGILKLNPTKAGGNEWFSTAWHNKIPREVSEGNTDPNDSRLKYLNGSPSSVKLKIDGEGNAYTDQFCSSVRIFTNDTWLNTEQTYYIYKDNDMTLDQATLRSRSRHEVTGGCSFGNYVARFRDTSSPQATQPVEKLTTIEVEVLHPHYRRGLDQQTLTNGLPQRQLIGLKQITQTEAATNNVIVKGLINYNILDQSVAGWQLTSQFTITPNNLSPDSGWATNGTVVGCAGLGDGQADKIIAGDLTMFQYLNTGQHCWLRLDGPTRTYVSRSSVREINPS